jgi:hypothetical protein
MTKEATHVADQGVDRCLIRFIPDFAENNTIFSAGSTRGFPRLFAVFQFFCRTENKPRTMQVSLVEAWLIRSFASIGIQENVKCLPCLAGDF